MTNLIKLPDINGNIHYHYFCPSCHYSIFGENIGGNYCPHCGTPLFWESEKAQNYHQSSVDYSIEYYERLSND